MSELLQVAAALRRASSTRQESVLATVVRTEGSTYRRIGARLVAFPDGSHVGAVSAGCIEADVLLRAERVRADGQVKLLTYETRSPEDLVWGSGTPAAALAFLDALSLPQVDLLGFSLGGMVAQEIALARPSLVRMMLLVGTAQRYPAYLSGRRAWVTVSVPRVLRAAGLVLPG